MNLIETLTQIVNRDSEEKKLNPSRKLAKVISKSGVVAIIEDVTKQTPLEISKEVIEDGKKMVVTTKWRKEFESNQVIVSITENSISFIGNNATQNYARLEGKSMRNRELIEKAITRMFSEPSKI